MRPHVMEWDEAQHFPQELLPKLAELGLMGIQFPERYGGAGMSAVDYCICIEELARVDPSVSLSVAAHNGLGAAHIAMFANEEQKQKYLVPLAKGETLAAWGLTEPGSGSDAAAMRTTRRQGRRLLGVERLEDVHHARHLGRHAGDHGGDRQVEGRRKAFPRSSCERGMGGLLAGKKEDKLGMRASETTEVILQNCRVSAAQLIGEEGQGFIQTLQVLDAGRIGIAALVGRSRAGRLRSGRATTPPSASSSGARSPRSRRSRSGCRSTRRASKRRAC